MSPPLLFKLERSVMINKTFAALAGLVVLTVVCAFGQSAATLNIQVNQPGAVVSSNLFGIFFEEINYAGEGGIYAEMVRNRAFYNSSSANFWTLVTQGSAGGTMSVDPTKPLNTNIVNSLKLTFQSGSGSVGAGNSGFWGMSIQLGATYDLNFYACASNGFSGPVSARLESANGSTVYAQTSFSGITGNWQRYAASLVPGITDTNARLVLSISQPGTIWLDVVSLFPRATFHNRNNGLRSDLANMLAALKPSFFRFPGGNYIESYNVTNAVRWKKSIGDIAERPGHMNDSWGYWSTDGFGAYEFFQYCEDMGMEPLYGINCGLMLGYNGNTNNTVPLDQMGSWVQDALDLIEYANGDTNTTWGSARAASGHPAPFNLKYLEIGNENGGPYYDARYTLFYDAIKSNYPNVKLISPVWGSPSSPVSRPVEVRDEHYYSSPSTFISYATKYDGYSRSGPKVFVGEYAVTSGYGTYGNLSAALGEAAFMTGMERNSDIVQLASYAPLFANVNGIQWHPDLIYYDGSRVFGTPSYYVQKLFSENRGDAVLPSSVTVTSNSTGALAHGAIGVGSWNTSVQYTNIVITSNGVTLYQSDFINQGTNGWQVYNGTWSTNAGLYQQTSDSTTDCRSTIGSTNWSNYTITLRARKISGSEGFLILFNWLDDNNWTWLNIGGWGNTLNGIEQNIGGTKTILGTRTPQTIAANTWYDITVVLTGARVQCYLNGNLIQDVTYPSGLIASTTYSKATGQVIVKAVNPYSQPIATTVNLIGVNAISSNASVIQLTSASPSDENSFSSPTYVSPVTNLISNAGTNFMVTLPANSVSVLRLSASGINAYTNLMLQVNSTISTGQTVPSTVYGQQSGVWVNLSTNTNYAITYSSANTNIAAVDINGNITGVGSGTANIIATYASLGLSATQAVNVVYVPVTLDHRYTFSETSGSVVMDSIGGAAWNGTLPNGGAFSAGQLSMSASAQQYVQLPAGILSNYTAVTIELWATFPTQLPSACFLFGFGNISGSSGYNYIFAQPRNGRIAITASDYLGEQNANAGFDFSFHTNLHITAVFNPPLGYIALYTNGVLAARNSSVTIPMSSVSNLYSFVGRSLYSNDSYFDLNLDELRIYNGALSANDIAATQVLGPDQLLSNDSPVINGALSGGNIALSWPVASAGYTVLTATNLIAGRWSAVSAPAPQIVGSQWIISIPITNTEQYFRLQK
jgi:alpha-L-arabinofuranosidase